MDELEKQRDSENKINRGEAKETRPLPENGTVVYCQFYNCVNNQSLADNKTLADFKFGYVPLFDKEALVKGVCNKTEIVLKNPGNVPSAFPDCFVYSNKQDRQTAGWSRNLDQSGHAIGGIIESQNSDHGNAALA